jgi:hypothetical protein
MMVEEWVAAKHVAVESREVEREETTMSEMVVVAGLTAKSKDKFQKSNKNKN